MQNSIIVPAIGTQPEQAVFVMPIAAIPPSVPKTEPILSVAPQAAVQPIIIGQVCFCVFF